MDKSEINKKLEDILLIYKKGGGVIHLVDDIIKQISPIRNGNDPYWEEVANRALRDAILCICDDDRTNKLTLSTIKDIVSVMNARLTDA